MKSEIAILLLFLSSLCVRAQEVWQIAWLQPSPVQIGGKAMGVGDEFTDRHEVSWSSDSQVMKVVEKNTHRCLVLSARARPQEKGGIIREYIDVCQKLSTRSQSYRESAGKGECFHYIGFEQNGSAKTLIPYEGMFMHNLPEEIWLCYTNTGTGEQRLETKDFRSLVRCLKITDDMLAFSMGVLDDETYLSLMSQFMNPEFRDIPLTFEEIHTYITLKY